MSDVQAPSTVTGHGRRGQKDEGYWRGHVEAWRGSGLTQSEYCRRGGVNWHGFRYWKAKMDHGLAGGGAGGTKLVAVKLPAGGGGCGDIRIRVGSRYVVEVSGSFEPEGLRQVLDLLERR